MPFVCIYRLQLIQTTNVDALEVLTRILQVSRSTCRSIYSDPSLDRADNQLGRVLPGVMYAGVKVRIQRLSESEPAVSINVSLCLCVVEGHRAFVIVQEYTDFLRNFFKVKSDGGPSAGAQATTATSAYRPVTVIRATCDGALPVDGLPGHPKIPVSFIPNLKHKEGQKLC